MTKEAYKEGQLEGGASFKKPVKSSYHYYQLAANVVWLVLVGWALAMGHLMAAMVSVRLSSCVFLVTVVQCRNMRCLQVSTPDVCFLTCA